MSLSFCKIKKKINGHTGEKCSLLVFYGTALNESCTRSLLSVDHLNIRRCALASLCLTLLSVFRPFCLAPIRHAPNWGGSEMTWRPFGKLQNVAQPFVPRPCVRIPIKVIKRTVAYRPAVSIRLSRSLGFPTCLFLASPLSGCTSSSQWRQEKSNFSPCFSLLEPHSHFTESFSWVSEGPSSLKETQTVKKKKKKKKIVDDRLRGHHPRALKKESCVMRRCTAAS